MSVPRPFGSTQVSHHNDPNVAPLPTLFGDPVTAFKWQPSGEA